MRISKAQVIERLKDAQREAGVTQESFAASLGISASYLSDMYRGNRGIPEKVLKALKLREVTEYEEVKK